MAKNFDAVKNMTLPTLVAVTYLCVPNITFLIILNA